jgi:hypothetical protein
MVWDELGRRARTHYSLLGLRLGVIGEVAISSPDTASSFVGSKPAFWRWRVVESLYQATTLILRVP